MSECQPVIALSPIWRVESRQAVPEKRLAVMEREL